MDAYAVIKAPVVTEKGHMCIEDENTYVFDVAKEAGKGDIKDAIEKIWGVSVENVRTMNVTGKPKRYRFRHKGYTRSWKKAMVRLAEGQAIDELK
jgi:large subunit ribosomal protein L23